MKEQAADERPRGWLTGAAVFGLFAALMPEIAACPLGWAAASKAWRARDSAWA